MDFNIREERTGQGRRKLVREREEYFRLMDQGLSSHEACRIVGINYRTGKRWRNGRNPTPTHKGAGAPPPGGAPPGGRREGGGSGGGATALARGGGGPPRPRGG
ncbi:hypothetical protein ACFWIY_04725, partial [Streptomyces sioyaensis]